MKVLRFIAGLVGLALIGIMVHEVGWTSIRQTLTWLGWGYGVILCYPLTWITFNTLGLRQALGDFSHRISLHRLAEIRLAGETFNSLLPSGYVGGEPLKAKLLSGTMPLRTGTSSVLVAKAAQSIGLVLFVGLGLSIAHPSGGSPWKQPGTLLAVVFLSIGIGIFTLLLANGAFARFGRFLHRLTGHPWFQQQDQRFLALDESLGTFYRSRKKEFLRSVLWHCAGWLSGALEVAIIFYLLGTPIDWKEAWFIGAMAQLAAVIGLLVPAGVGLYEGGHYLAASMLGLPPSMGLSVSLIRRVREIFWDGVGVFLFWKLTRKTGVRVS